MIWRSHRIAGPRRLAVLAIAALVPVLAGCEAGANAPTQQWHQPTDGAATVHNDIAIRNVFVLGAPIGTQLAAGHSAGLFLALINEGSPDRLLSITAPGTAKSVTLPGGTVRLGSQQSVLLTGPAPKVILQDLTRPLSRRHHRQAGAELPERRERHHGRPGDAAGPVLLDVLAGAEPHPDGPQGQARHGHARRYPDAEREPDAQHRAVTGQPEGSNLYPSPRTVRMCVGFAGSASTLARSRLTWTSRVLVSPT